MRERIVIVVQARTGSTRLPGKVLMPLKGKPLLARVLERISAAKEADAVIVATTWEDGDATVAKICEEIGMPCYRGHPTDLLDRHVQAAKFLEQQTGLKADAVVKIPSDQPLIDPAVIDRVLGAYRAGNGAYDYFSNVHPATYPDGNDVEVMKWQALEAAHSEATKSHEREHTTSFFWDQPERFNIGNITWESGLDYSMSHRFTIDYQADYDFITAVYDELFSEAHPIFSVGEICALLDRRPDIYAINAHLAGVNWYRNHLGELKTISAANTKFPAPGE